jgi:hypothetical protein
MPWSALACTALLLAALAPGANAAESLDSCAAVIDALPANIVAPGTYCLAQNLSTANNSVAAIGIDADNVILDCNGFRIDGTGLGTGVTVGGIIAPDHSNVTIRNCHIRGFKRGIHLYNTGGSPSQRHVVEDNRIELSRAIGIQVEGNGSVIRRNQVLNTINPNTDNEARGIATTGNVDVIDNTVSGVQATNAAVYGVLTEGNAGGSLRGNRVRGVKRTGGVGQVVAIQNQGDSQRMSIRNNHVVGEAQAGSVGIFCDVVTDRTKGNAVEGFTTGISNCGNDGNVVKP